MSFPCFASHISPESGGGFASFIEAIEAGRVHNPWPQIVDLSCPDMAWSQPFIKGLYIPTTRPEDLILKRDTLSGFWNDSLPVDYRVATVHETLHLVLDTPAKEWARICLALAYNNLRVLLNGEMAGWDEFRVWNSLFRQTVARIVLAEELLVITLSLRIVEARLAGELEREELRRVEEDQVTAYGKQLGAGAFEGLYWGFKKGTGPQVGKDSMGFRKLGELLTPPSRLLIQKVAAFLEPLNVDLNVPEAVDSTRRCVDLSDAVNGMETSNELDDWISHKLASSDDITSWMTALGVQGDLHRDGNSTMGPLWKLVRGRTPSKRTGTARQAHIIVSDYCTHDTPFNLSLTVFYPVRSGRYWYIRPSTNFRRDIGYVEILILESFRQQLDSGIGIRCPFRYRSSCVCRAEVEYKPLLEKIQRLAERVREFGNGASPDAMGFWTSLPHPCNGDALH